ncbi:MAG: TetR/AcrR family transcriptional regulator [Deltaproteobacteria bacterium]|nr:TetR/AcrR family transcriptional regulator [Deltaproteobacteria bacterium]
MARTVDLHRRTDLALRALAFVRSQGMRRITMSELAAALGMGRPALYWYFKNLGEVFDAVLAVILERQRAFLLERMAVTDDPLGMVEAWLRGVCAFYAEDPQLLAVLIQFWAMGDPERPEKVLEATRDYAVQLQDAATLLLGEAIAAGLVADCHVQTLVELCAATLDGLLIQQSRQGTDPLPALDLFCRRVLDPLRLPAAAQAATRS